MAEAKNKKPFGRDLSFASVESYNLLRTNIQFTLPAKDHGRIVGITSSCPSEGKTYTSINIAYSIACLGKKVLLIDGDMRKPSVGRYFEIRDTKQGLSNVLINPNIPVIKHSGVSEFLDFVSSGEIPPNPSELIGSRAMKNFLDEMTKKYEYIFIDLPPVGVVSDALAISPYLDGIVCVVRHGITRPRDLREAIARLELAKANILGFVYNAFFHRRASHYYYRKGYGKKSAGKADKKPEKTKKN